MTDSDCKRQDHVRQQSVLLQCKLQHLRTNGWGLHTANLPVAMTPRWIAFIALALIASLAQAEETEPAGAPCVAPPTRALPTYLAKIEASRRSSAQESEGFLLGYPPTSLPWAARSKRVATAIVRQFGVDARCIRVVLLDRKALGARQRKMSGRVSAETDGFHYAGLTTGNTVFVHQDQGEFDEATVVHEVLHARSQRFSFEAHDKRLWHLIEGLTEHFTRRLMIEQFKQPESSISIAYPNYVAFAKKLTDLMGHERVVRHFFHGGYGALKRDVDAKTAPGTLVRAALALQRDECDNAMALLEPTR